jgi:hypothetical protein
LLSAPTRASFPRSDRSTSAQPATAASYSLAGGAMKVIKPRIGPGKALKEMVRGAEFKF